MKRIIFFLFILNATSVFSQYFDWAKLIGSNSISSPKLDLDSNGNIILTGYFDGNIDFDAGDGTFYMSSSYESSYILKYDSFGNFIWAKSFKGNNDVNSNSLITDNLGNVYSVGDFYGRADFDPNEGEYEIESNGSGVYDDIYISKLNSDGEFVWAKSVGGISWDNPYSITISPNHQFIYITGFFRSTVDFNPDEDSYILESEGAGDMFLLKFDSNGNFIWVNQIGGGLGDEGRSVTTDNSGNIYVTGNFRNTAYVTGHDSNIYSNGSADVYLAKYSEDGSLLWIKTFGGTNGDYGLLVKTDQNENIYISGTYEGVVDFDPSESEYFLTSTTNDKSTFIAKFSPIGDFIWAKSIDNPIQVPYPAECSLNVDNANNVYLSGYYGGAVDFDPNEGNYVLESLGLTNGYILKLNQHGEFVWVISLDGNESSTSKITSLYIDDSGSIFSTGISSDDVDLDPNEDTFYTEQEGLFILKLTQENLDNNDYYSEKTVITVFPNPVKSQLTIQYTNELIGGQYFLYNLLGQQLKVGILRNLDGKENIEILEVDGIYLLKLKEKNGREYDFKIIKNNYYSVQHGVCKMRANVSKPNTKHLYTQKHFLFTISLS